MAFWLKGGFHGTLSSPSGSDTAMTCFMRVINLQGTSLSPATANCKFLKDVIVEVYFYSVLFKQLVATAAFRSCMLGSIIH